MKDINEMLETYESKIDVIVSKYRKFYRKDLKQELLSFLYYAFENNTFKHAENMQNYIYICLKNEALRLYKKEYNEKCKMISLDEIEETSGMRVHEIIMNRDEGENESHFCEEYSGELETKICQICSKNDYQLIYDVFVNNINQKDIARELGISQQAVSKRIKKILNKLRINLKV